MDETLKDNGDSTSTENLERNQSSKNHFTSENARKTTFFFFFSVMFKNRNDFICCIDENV